MLVHDNKPIQDDAGLRAAIAPTTQMLPTTPARPENKALIEGEFGQFEQAVGALQLDDSTLENLKRSAVSEAIMGTSTVSVDWIRPTPWRSVPARGLAPKRRGR
jgi:hypothetical protein